MRAFKTFNEIEYQIVHDLPPNYEELVKVFGEGANWYKGTVFTYAKTIFCKDPIPDHVLAHECIHIRQQMEIGVKEWWKRYIKDVGFRLEQEIEAYRTEYKYVVDHLEKHKHFYYLRYFATSMSKMYGFNMSVLQAINLIKNYE